MHVSIDTLIFIQHCIFSAIISLQNPSSGKLLGYIWLAYIIALILKVVFYTGFHPWADVLRNDIGPIFL